MVNVATVTTIIFSSCALTLGNNQVRASQILHQRLKKIVTLFNLQRVLLSSLLLQALSLSSNVILPTLTAKMQKIASNSRRDVRVLYDPASQSSFISEKLLN